MTHSHDTPTPAMSTETVPSEEFVLVPREPTPAMKSAILDSLRYDSDIYVRDDETIVIETVVAQHVYHAMIAAAPILSASHLAKEGGEAGAMEAEVERLSKVYAEATGYYVPFHAGLHSESSNRIRTGVKAVLAAAPQPSPALAKGGDAVRVSAAQEQRWVMGDGITPLIEGHYRVLIAGDSETVDGHTLYEFGDYEEWAYWTPAKPEEFEDFEGGYKGKWSPQYADHEDIVGFCGPFHVPSRSAPTEGPASQTEGMGGDAEARRKRVSELMAPLMELSEDELILLRYSLPVETLARLRAAITPPETLGNPATEAEWQDRHGLSADEVANPEAARLREELERESEESYEIGKRDGYEEAVQHIDQRTGGDGEYCCVVGYDADDRHCPDPQTMIVRIVGRFESLAGQTNSANQERDDAAKALESVTEELGLFRDFVINNATVWTTGSNHHHPIWARVADRLEGYTSPRDGEKWHLVRAATASDPAPATDDRERLVEALAPADRAVQSLGALISTRPHSAERDLRDRYFEWMQSVQRAHADIRDALNVARAAFATEASR